MSTSFAEYRHRPLEEPHKQIRLLSLSLGDINSEHRVLDLSSKIFELDSLPAFTAVSYEWGSSDEASIRVNGSYFHIRRNLHQFLRTFAESSKDAQKTWLWIDQISIDQSSVRERNAQVMLMSEIYSRAENVIAWLGNQSKDDGWLLSEAVARYAKKQKPTMAKRLSRSFSLLARRGSKKARTEEKRPEDVLKPLRDAEIHAIRALLGADYWSRHWINMEIALASRCSFLFGRNFTDRDQLCQLMLEYANARLLPQDVLFLSDLLMFQDRQRWAGTLDGWVTAMRLSATSQCLDTRDKIFGIQAGFPEQLRIDVDYTIAPEAVLSKAIDAYIRGLTVVSTGDIALGILNLADGMNLGPRVKLSQTGKTRALQVLEYRIVKYRNLASQGEEKKLIREAILRNAIEDFVGGKLPDDESSIPFSP